ARLFRRAYPDPLYVRLTGQVQVLWQRLADEAGEEVVTTTGAVDYGPAREQEKMYEILSGFGVPAEPMAAAAAGRSWAGNPFRPRPGHVPSRRRRDRPGARDGGDARQRRRARRADQLRHAGAARRGRRRRSDRAHGGPVVARAGGGGRRRRLARTAARRAGAAA